MIKNVYTETGNSYIEKNILEKTAYTGILGNSNYNPHYGILS